MPWEIPIYICSRFAEALEQIYIPVGLFPHLVWKRDLCMDIMYTYEYCIHIWIIRYHVYTYGYCIHIWILYIHMDTVYIVYTYGYSIKTPPGGFRWKIEIFSSKIFLTKVLFLETKTSEYYLDSNSASRKLIKPWYRLFFTTCSSKQNLCRMFTIVALLDLVTLIRSRSSCRTSIRSRKKTVHSWMLLAICGQV